MPNARNNPNAVSARRFAALLAGFDVCNASDEEALSKGLALRRMALQANMRIVDLLELPDVKQAIDDQLQPARKESPVLQEALEQTAALHQELTERTRDVRKLAELLRQQEERTEELSRELAVARSSRRAANTSWTPRPSPSVASAPAPAGRAAVRLPGADSWMVMLTAVLALALLVAAIFGGHFHEAGGNGNGMGNGQRISASGVHQGRAVRALPEHGAVRHRLHRGGASHRTR